jgi:hypothetical protein
MGVACCGSANDNSKHSKKKKPSSSSSLNKYNTTSSKKNKKIKKIDIESSIERDSKSIDNREKILRRGKIEELEEMIENYDEDINEYTFGQNKTLLLEACNVCPNSEVIDLIMKKGADIDKEEYHTGNTAIFLSALDLKVDFVEKLLEYNPNLLHKNHNQQNIFEFLKFFLIEERKSINRELSKKEKVKYEKIENMLKKKAQINNNSEIED